MTQQFTITITDPAGMHARPAGRLVQQAQQYDSSVTLRVGDKTTDAKSILGVMGLGIAQGDAVEFTIDGRDEGAAATGLEQMLRGEL